MMTAMALKDEPTMNVSRAHYVRWLRVDKGLTWQQVAEQCKEQWAHGWSLLDLPRLGQAICEMAARELGESPDEDPWN